jgi:hypothetical protein
MQPITCLEKSQLQNDNIQRFCECEEENHRNTIYWEKPVNIRSSPYKTEEMNRRRRGKAEGVEAFSQQQGDNWTFPPR